MPRLDQGEPDNENITVLPDHLFTHALTTLTTPLVTDWTALIFYGRLSLGLHPFLSYLIPHHCALC
jgi:hypothetical protein